MLYYFVEPAISNMISRVKSKRFSNLDNLADFCRGILVFNSLITLLLESVVFPALVIGFGLLWLHLFPEYCLLLTLITLIVLMWFSPVDFTIH